MAMDYFLKQINPAVDVVPIKLFLDKNETIIGRRSIISLTGFNKVSRKHAKFLNKNGRWFISDLESLNKLYVNFKEVGSDWTPLEIGDIIGFGTPSYFEDGGLVCVFAANHRIKQEFLDETDSPNFATKNTQNVQNSFTEKDVKFLRVKQEFPFGTNEDVKKETKISNPKCISQIDVSASSKALSYIPEVTKAISDQSNLIASQKKQESGSNKLNLVIKTEPMEIDIDELLSVKNTSSNENLPIKQKLATEHESMFNDSDSTMCEVKFSLQNNIEEKKEPPCNDKSSDISDVNMSSGNEVNEKVVLTDLISENKILTCSDKVEVGKCFKKQNATDLKHYSKEMKSCSVKLVRCDSNFFRWPPEINFPELFETIDNHGHFSQHRIINTSQDEKKKEVNCSQVSQQQNFIYRQKRKKLKDDIQKHKHSVGIPSHLKINKNRIMSSSSEMSSNETDCEKDSSASNNISYKKRIKNKFKKQSRDKRNLCTSRRDNSSSDETSQALKVSEKQKHSFSEILSSKRKRHKQEYENKLYFNESESFKLQPYTSVSSKKANDRNSRISSCSRDESSFFVERRGCSKYWTPEYNEFETGEVRDCWKSNTYIKMKETAGRTLLTDPKPIEYRPKRMRGREEWFKEKSSYSRHDRDKKGRMSENADEEDSRSKIFSKMPSNRGCVSLKEKSFVANRKISTGSTKGNSLFINRKSSSEPLPSETLPEPVLNFSNSGRKHSTDVPCKTLQVTNANDSVSATKISKESSLVETSAASRGNSLIINRRNSVESSTRKSSKELSLTETVAASSGNSLIISQKHSIKKSSRDNSFVESREKPMKDKLDNSALTKSTAVIVQMNTVSSVQKPRNSPGGRTRFLVEIQTNEDKTLKGKQPTEKEILPDCLENQDCSAACIANSTKSISPSELLVAETTQGEKKDINNAVATVCPNNKSMCFPVTISTSSLEKKNEINLSERENELSASKRSETSEMEPTLAKPVAKTNDTQFLPKQLFSKNDKNLNDKKVAVVTPHQKTNQHAIVPTSHFHNPVKETITNRVHSTYILSPVKTQPNPVLLNADPNGVEDTISSSCEDSKYRSQYLIKNIVQWNPKWLEEQAKNKKPPPVVSLGGSLLPLIFSSYDTYIKSFYPMISLEIWESLYRESKPFWFRKETKNAFYYKIKSNNLKHSFIELQCESIVNENLSFLPCEGNIILLGFNEFGNGLENSLLGYVYRHKIESSHEIENSKGWQKVPEEWQQNAKLWTFSVYIKKTKKNFSIGLVSIAYGILNIKSKLQLADALSVFKDSPIQSDILRPTKEMFAFCKSISKISRPQLIQAISEEIKKENPHSKLILINAPVATGKTGAIIGIVEKLLFSNVSRMKLLLCAFSDLTVDEIGLRLVELNERCSWRGSSIKFVRFGQSENVPSKLQPYTLARKVLKMFKEQNKKEFQERERELKILEDKINDVLFKEQLKINDKYRFRKSNDEGALKQLLEQLQSLKENSLYKNIDPIIHATYECAILNDSDVVLTTLNCCMQPQMRKFFSSCKGKSHSCCIIDEISQCTELEVLQCLHPEINRLVLVGDLQQLPPQVSSKYAIKCGFKRSMMERIVKLFSVQFSTTPPLSLVEQHRMQSQIFHFPSKYFYKEQLFTASGVDERYKYNPLKPFVVYDILEKEMGNPSVNIEHSEPFIIANICAQFVQAMPTASLGVIVACEDLAAMYRIPLSQGNAALKEIEVNTVENYQGIEKDIIVISCINPSLFAENDNFLSSEKKMNVAITRARQSLVICGHVSSVVQFKHWAALINDAKERKNFISVSSLRQVPFVVMKSICRVS